MLGILIHRSKARKFYHRCRCIVWTHICDTTISWITQRKMNKIILWDYIMFHNRDYCKSQSLYNYGHPSCQSTKQQCIGVYRRVIVVIWQLWLHVAIHASNIIHFPNCYVMQPLHFSMSDLWSNSNLCRSFCANEVPGQVILSRWRIIFYLSSQLFHSISQIVFMPNFFFSFAQKLAGAPPELALVVFHTHGPYSGMPFCHPYPWPIILCAFYRICSLWTFCNIAFSVQRSGWTKDIDAFLSWLSRISFSGGGFSEASTCEGLAEALTVLTFLCKLLVPCGQKLHLGAFVSPFKNSILKFLRCEYLDAFVSPIQDLNLVNRSYVLVRAWCLE